MNENGLKSKKIKLNKIFLLLWLIILVVLIVIVVITYKEYTQYKEAQEVAVAYVFATSDEFDAYKDDYNETVRRMYNFFNPNHVKVTYNGISIDNSNAVAAARKADLALAEIMRNAGYNCIEGSYFLKYIGYMDYTKRSSIPFIVWGALAIILVLANLWYYSDKEAEVIIDDEKIICKKGKKTIKGFLIKDVKSVSITPMKGIKIVGNGVKYKINLVKNGDEIRSVIMEKLATPPVVSSVIALQDNSVDALVKYKKLLDNGVISKEEFDVKKKQLLNLGKGEID